MGGGLVGRTDGKGTEAERQSELTRTGGRQCRQGDVNEELRNNEAREEAVGIQKAQKEGETEEL